MPGARVRWRTSEEHFEVLDHGILWFDDDSSIIGAFDVAKHASLTEFRRALDRYRATTYDGEFTLAVFDVDELLLREDEMIVPPRDVALEMAHDHSFIVVTLVVDPSVRFDRYELAAILSPQLRRHRAVMVQISDDPTPIANVVRMTVEISPRGRTVGDALEIGEQLLALWGASAGGSLTPAAVVDLLRAQRPELMIGQPESVWFEAKGCAYDLRNPLEAIELAKDVSAMANRSEGGLLVLGLTTHKRAGIDTVRAVRPISTNDLRPKRYQQSLDKWIFPPPQDLLIETIEVGPNEAVMLIHVPPQPDSLLPFLVRGAVRDGRLLGSHFSLVRRRGDDTAITDAEAVHGLSVAGRAALAMASAQSDSASDTDPPVATSL